MRSDNCDSPGSGGDIKEELGTSDVMEVVMIAEAVVVTITEAVETKVVQQVATIIIVAAVRVPIAIPIIEVLEDQIRDK